MNIGVIGAGIIGLTTVQMLNEQFPNVTITLIAEEFSPNTTSDGAAGIFRPSPSFSGPNSEITKQWIDDSYYLWKEYQLDKYCTEFKGIVPVSGYIFSKISERLTKNHFLERLVPKYRSVTDEELQMYSKCGFKYGSFYETILIDSKIYLKWAMDRFQQNSGTILNRKVFDFSEIDSYKFNYIFNCSGLGAQILCADSKLVPIRGQVFKVKNPQIRNFVYADFDTYIIPGLNGFATLGGCRHYESYSLEWNKFDGDSIWERCVQLESSLNENQIAQKWTGLRPHRDSVRVEIDKVRNRNAIVIHNYGHGGYGITSAPGTVKYAINLLRENLRAKL